MYCGVENWLSMSKVLPIIIPLHETLGTASSPDTTDGIPRVICRFGKVEFVKVSLTVIMQTENHLYASGISLVSDYSNMMSMGAALLYTVQKRNFVCDHSTVQ